MTKITPEIMRTIGQIVAAVYGLNVPINVQNIILRYPIKGIGLILTRGDFDLGSEEIARLMNKIPSDLEDPKEKGWRPEDLLNPVTLKPKARHTRKAKNKYAYLAENGETQYWTGRGRMPAALKAQVESGKSLDSFLIQE